MMGWNGGVPGYYFGMMFGMGISWLIFIIIFFYFLWRIARAIERLDKSNSNSDK